MEESQSPIGIKIWNHPRSSTCELNSLQGETANVFGGAAGEYFTSAKLRAAFVREP